MRQSSRGSGFSIVGIVATIGVVVLLVGVGIVGWRALSEQQVTAGTTGVSTRESAEVITTKADLEAAEKALGELDFEDDDALEAESQANL